MAAGRAVKASGTIGATLTQIDAAGIKALLGGNIFNGSAATAYLQMFDAAAVGNVTLGTTAPDLSIGIPTGQQVPIIVIGDGILFRLGIVIAFTTTRGGAVAPASSIDYNLYYA